MLRVGPPMGGSREGADPVLFAAKMVSILVQLCQPPREFLPLECCLRHLYGFG